MRRMTALLSAAALVLGTAGTLAQGKADFAGKWTMVVDPAAAAGGGGRGGGRGGGGGGGGFNCGMECTITQDAKALTVTRVQGENTITMAFNLDGTESKNKMMGRGGEATEVTAKAMWDGAKLVVTTTTPNGEAKAVLSIEGGNLVVDRTTPGRDGGAATTAKQTYKKS